MTDAAQAAERAARLSYGRLVSILAARGGGIAAAEDALAEALTRALTVWPERGVPASPEGWLVAVARRAALDEGRRRGALARAADHLSLLEAERAAGRDWPDERLRLLFACAGREVEPALRAPLMLQVVLGLDARRIASAFLVPPNTMGVSLSRAKARLRESAPGFAPPAPDEAAERVGDVLRAIYAAYSLGLDGAHGLDEKTGGLADEALWLGGLAAALAPEEPEALGLHALMLFAESRGAARRDAFGRYVPLDRQDMALWSTPMIEAAEAALRRAAAFGRPGRFQLEAAIQSVHADRRRTGRTDWAAILALYDGLLALAPSLGALTGRAVALGEARGAKAGLEALEAAPEAARARYQPWRAARAHLLARSGARGEAAAEFRRAAGLSEDPAARAWLLERAAEAEAG